MSVRIGTGLSTLLEPRAAALDAATAAAAELGDGACDLVVVFASGGVLGAPELVLEAVHEILRARRADRVRRGRRDRPRAGDRGRHGGVRLGGDRWVTARR